MKYTDIRHTVEKVKLRLTKGFVTVSHNLKIKIPLVYFKEMDAMLESLYYSSDTLKITLACYTVTLFFYIIALIASKRMVKNPLFLFFITTFFFMMSFSADTWLIVERWLRLGHPPFQTMFEATLLVTWTISLVYIVVELLFKVRLIGLFTTLGIIVFFLFAVTKRDIYSVPLKPALQSPLFVPHVVSYILGYGAIFVAFVSAALSLIFPKGAKGFWVMSTENQVDFSRYNYLIVQFGFFVLTLGFLIGAWWGQDAWSKYWGWDPKENWALISWLMFVVFLHLRYIKKWNEKKLAVVLIVGFAVVIFTYLGMKYLPNDGGGLHNYAS